MKSSFKRTRASLEMNRTSQTLATTVIADFPVSFLMKKYEREDVAPGEMMNTSRVGWGEGRRGGTGVTLKEARLRTVKECDMNRNVGFSDNILQVRSEIWEVSGRILVSGICCTSTCKVAIKYRHIFILQRGIFSEIEIL